MTRKPFAASGRDRYIPWSNPPPAPWTTNTAGPSPAVAYSIGPQGVSTTVLPVVFGTYDGARYSAEYVPGARFISYPSGGHLWVGHQEELMRQIADFLRKAA